MTLSGWTGVRLSWTDPDQGAAQMTPPGKMMMPALYPVIGGTDGSGALTSLLLCRASIENR